MPTLPPVPKVVRTDFHWVQSTDSNLMVRLFFQYTGSLSTTDAQTWLDNIVAAMGTFMSTVINSEMTLTMSQLTDLTSNSAAQVQSTVQHVGGIVQAPLPTGTAMVMKYHIARRYRGGHPRTYIPGLSYTYLTTSGQFNSTSLSSVVSAWETFLAACTASTNPAAIGTIVHVNVSFFSGFTNVTLPSNRVKSVPKPRVTPLVDTITGVGGNPAPASQRRRNETP